MRDKRNASALSASFKLPCQPRCTPRIQQSVQANYHLKLFSYLWGKSSSPFYKTTLSVQKSEVAANLDIFWRLVRQQGAFLNKVELRTALAIIYELCRTYCFQAMKSRLSSLSLDDYG